MFDLNNSRFMSEFADAKLCTGFANLVFSKENFEKSPLKLIYQFPQTVLDLSTTIAG